MSETPGNPEDGAAEALKSTPLIDLHRESGGKMVPFAGYAMPVHYTAGIMREHLHTRAAAGLFDVSHMGQAALSPDGDDPAAALESLVPGELQALKPGRMRYTLLLNDRGGILDDLMVGRPTDPDDKRLLLVVNAACKDADFAHIAEILKGRARLERADDHALLALQGPQAAEVFARYVPEAATLKFMSGMKATLLGVDCWITRSGYTGEDGYEISVPADRAERLARDLVAEPEVLPIGLGARDSLRLEAGLCLYGHDIDETTTPVEANLAWAIGKRRRAEGGFPGAGTILKQLAEGPARRRVGLKPEGRAPVREGAPVTDPAGTEIGTVTSGGFGPSVGGPVAMGYVAAAQAGTGTQIAFTVRGKSLPGHVADLPFVPQRYYRG